MNKHADLLPLLRQALGADSIVDEPDGMAPYLSDWRGLYRGAALAVVRPDTPDAVAICLRFCGEHGLGIVPQGGNTGLVGGATPAGDGSEIVLSLERIRRIRSIDADDFSMTVEAGCILADVQAAAEAANRYFPLSLGAEGTCQIGGNISTNAGGINVLRYGNMRDLVLGLEVVLANGTIWNDLRRVRKDNTGYALRQLLIGAEGTLGIVTAAVLRLFPLPRQKATALVAVGGIELACSLFRRFMEEAGEFISSFEYMSGPAIALAIESVEGAALPFPHPGGDCVLIELAATLKSPPLSEQLEAILGSALEAGQIENAVIPDNEAKRAGLWRLREAIVEAQRLGGASIKHDISVPISDVPAFVRQAEEAVHGVLPDTRILPFGHLGDGNLHYNLLCPPGFGQDAFRELGPDLTRAVHSVVHAFDGSFSAEHGLGQLRRDEANRIKCEIERRLMREIKATFDPGAILNRGKLI
jgi:FAD/FMN-containing dehydrogenase